MSKRVLVVAVMVLLSVFTPCVAEQTGTDAASPERARAMELYEQNNFRDALPLFEKLAEQVPNDAVVQERLGMCVVANAAAIEDLEQRKRERVRGRRILMRAKELGDNSNLLQVLLDSIPEDGGTATFSDNKEVDQIMRQAEAAFTKGDMKTAIDGYVRAIILDPNLYEAALFAGDAYYKQKIYGSAGEWFSRAIQINPNLETAYRYWGDALMAQGKMGEARQKFIEAIVAEPYRKNAWFGLQQWADAQKIKIEIVRIKSPNAVTMDGNKTNITIDPASLKKNDGSSAWMIYDLSKALWMRETFFKEFPNEKTYRHSLKEESSQLHLVASSAREQAKNDKKVKLDPALQSLVKLDDAGLIEPYVLFFAADAGIAQDYAGYREKNRDKLRQYLDEYVVPKAPAN